MAVKIQLEVFWVFMLWVSQ